MIANRDSPHIKELIAKVPEAYKSDVEAALNELENDPYQLNPESVTFNKYKIKVADGDIEIIFEWNWGGRVRIVDIRERRDFWGILRKMRDMVDITPKP